MDWRKYSGMTSQTVVRRSAAAIERDHLERHKKVMGIQSKVHPQPKSYQRQEETYSTYARLHQQNPMAKAPETIAETCERLAAATGESASYIEKSYRDLRDALRTAWIPTTPSLPSIPELCFTLDIPLFGDDPPATKAELKRRLLPIAVKGRHIRQYKIHHPYEDGILGDRCLIFEGSHTDLYCDADWLATVFPNPDKVGIWIQPEIGMLIKMRDSECTLRIDRHDKSTFSGAMDAWFATQVGPGGRFGLFTEKAWLVDVWPVGLK